MPRSRLKIELGFSVNKAAQMLEITPRTALSWKQNGSLAPKLHPQDEKDRYISRTLGLYGSADLLRLKVYWDMRQAEIPKIIADRIGEELWELVDPKTQAADLYRLAEEKVVLMIPKTPESAEQAYDAFGQTAPILQEGQWLIEALQAPEIQDQIAFMKYPLHETAAFVAGKVKVWRIGRALHKHKAHPWVCEDPFEQKRKLQEESEAYAQSKVKGSEGVISRSNPSASVNEPDPRETKDADTPPLQSIAEVFP